MGCSGWSYRDWRGVVYPADLPYRRWFEYYTTLFDTVELNNTFYRLPTQQAMEGWAAAAPKDFLFALKLGQFGSCLLYTSPSPRDRQKSRMPSSA